MVVVDRVRTENKAGARAKAWERPSRTDKDETHIEVGIKYDQEVSIMRSRWNHGHTKSLKVW